ncbi:hypothetical protein [Tardiphaga sp. 367_B4_N1_1]|uniref:hypothetical protein n=1 Tax=Tardiphaga sp. 367_B4_N1_1 TaxID=3240777 RepID=UPI003F23FEE8
MLISWPADLKPIDGGYVQSVKSLSGGQSLSGHEQVAPQLADRWMASFTFNVNSDAMVLAMRAFLIGMRGRTNSVLLPAFDLARAPWRADAYGRKVTPGLVRNPRLDGTPYADTADLRSTLITAKMSASALLNAVTISVAMVSGGKPLPGHFLSIGNRMHAVTDVTGAGPYALGIWPWLRDDAALNAAVNFAAPACEMRFATDGEGAAAMAALAQLRFGKITLNFDEVP